MGPCTPLYNTVPIQHRQISKPGMGSCLGEEFLNGNGWSQWQTVLPFLCFLSLKPGAFVIKREILYLLQLILTAAEIKLQWLNQLFSTPLNSILTTWGILIIGCLFQTYTSALLVALGAEKPATRDNGSTVAFSLSGQIPELTSSAIMVHRSNHSDIRW